MSRRKDSKQHGPQSSIPSQSLPDPIKEPDPVPPSLDVGVPTDPNDVQPEEPTYTVKLTASQIKALQDVLSGAVRVPGVTGATPVHDNDAGASSAISTAVSQQDDLQDSDAL
jgi:hypothetical protein